MDRQDVGGVRPEIGAEVLPNGGGCELQHVLRKLILGVTPGEVGRGLGKAELGQPLHHAWPGKGLSQKQDSGVLRLQLRDNPLPERESLGMRVVYAEDAYALIHPKAEDTLEGLPEPLPVG